jgi:ankyrin repeat protein
MTIDERLWCAVGRGSDDEVAFLLAQGANPNWHDNSLGTPVHRAALFGADTHLRFLLNAGGLTTTIDADGETPLHVAAAAGSLNIVETLLAAGSDMMALSDYGTPLDRAAYNGDARVVACLLNHGVSARYANDWGRTPLHIACSYVHSETALLLLRRGANPDAVDWYRSGTTPLHNAAAAEVDGIAESLVLYGIVEALLLYGADVQVRNAWGATPLHLACGAGIADIVSLLLRGRADPQAADDDGRSPGDYVRSHQTDHIPAMLKVATVEWAESELFRKYETRSACIRALQSHRRGRRIPAPSATANASAPLVTSPVTPHLPAAWRRAIIAEALQDPNAAARRNQMAHRLLRGGRYDSPIAVVRDIPVLPLRAVETLSTIARHQDLDARVKWMSVNDDPLLVFFVSHRWDHRAHPDPFGTQLQVLKRLGSNLINIATALRLPYNERRSLVPSLAVHGILQAAYLLGEIAPFLAGFFSDANALRNELLDRIGLVYDFMSFPQAPRTASEEDEFALGLMHSQELFRSSVPVIAIRYPDDDYESRCWCELECWSRGGDPHSTVPILRTDKLNDAIDLDSLAPPHEFNSWQDHNCLRRALTDWSNEQIVSAQLLSLVRRHYDYAFSWQEKLSATPQLTRPDIRSGNEADVSNTAVSFQFFEAVRSRLVGPGLDNTDLAAFLASQLEICGLGCSDDRDLIVTALWLLGCHDRLYDWLDVFYGRCLLRWLEGKDLVVTTLRKGVNVHFRFGDGEEYP